MTVVNLDEFEPPEECYVTDDDIDKGLIIHADDDTDLLGFICR